MRSLYWVLWLWWHYGLPHSTNGKLQTFLMIWKLKGKQIRLLSLKTKSKKRKRAMKKIWLNIVALVSTIAILNSPAHAGATKKVDLSGTPPVGMVAASTS